MRKLRLSASVPLLFTAVFLLHTASAAACKVDERWPGGVSTVQYYEPGNPAYGNAINNNFGDWGSIFRDADDDACVARARGFFQAKLSAQSAVSGSWTGWLKGGDVFLMSAAALRLGARGLLTSSLHGQILGALSSYYGSSVAVGCSNSGGNGCMDEYSVAAAGFAWAGVYLLYTQSSAGTHPGSDFLTKARDYVSRSLSPLHSICIHHIVPRSGAGDSCTTCTTDYNPGGPYANNAADLRTRIALGQTEVLSYEHLFENPSYGIGLLPVVGTAVLGLHRVAWDHNPSELEKVVAHGLFRNGQLHAKPGATACDLTWPHDYCVGSGCTATNTTCITTVCAPPQSNCVDQFGSYEYNPGMFPVRGLLSREYALANPSDLILGSSYYQFDQFNGLCSSSQTPFRTYTPLEFNDFFHDGRWASYYTFPVVWSASSYTSDPKPRLAGLNPVQHVDSPSPFLSQPVRSGPNSFFGWAFDGEGSLTTGSFSFTVDGLPVTLQGFGYGGSRTDVCAFFSLTNQPPSCPLGWGGTYTPPAGFTTGWHTFQVRIQSSTGSVSTFRRSFYYTP